ncbi:MAG: phosphoribosyltransferase family protein [Oscillospiraceae bacterium]|jgi:hypothetical protein|nr:phosphoribosyltransferase family protein [Oscillospiraceae bacterium]
MPNLPENIQIAVREKNDKRAVLFVNELLGKHIPVSPSRVRKCFHKFAGLVSEFIETNYPDAGKKKSPILLIGFAETATALSKSLYDDLSDDFQIDYACTTREERLGQELGIPPIVRFKEEHSHAPEHLLYFLGDLSKYKYFLLVDDEMSTGNTARNLWNALQATGQLREDAHFVPVCLALNEKVLGTRELDGITMQTVPPHDEIVLPEIKDYSELVKVYTGELPEGEEVPPLLTEMDDKLKAFEQVKSYELGQKQRNVLVIGTEENMCGPLRFAYLFEKLDEQCKIKRRIRLQATTRTPIIPQSRADNIDYPLFRRAELPSFYDPERVTYIYNLMKFEIVFVFACSDEETSRPARIALYKALKERGCEDIVFIDED